MIFFIPHLYFSLEADFLAMLIESVKEVEAKLISEYRGREGSSSSVPIRPLTCIASLPPYEQRLEQLDEWFGFDTDVTQIFGIVGMTGIGKTILAKKHFDNWKKKLMVKKMILGIHERSKNEEGSDWLIKDDDIFKSKSFIFLDDVTEKTQIQSLLDNLHRIKKGSKIVITTRDKSWIGGVVHDTYVVPGLNEKEALQLFHYHAFHKQDYTPTQNITKLSKKFVDYAGGNPLALEELGKELCGQHETHWETRIETLPHCCNENIKRKLKISYDKLTDQQKDAFLDIACFFRSEDEDCLKSLLASEVSHESDEAAGVIGDLAHKFMISVSAGQIEMPDILCSLGKELGLEENLGKSRLWDHDAVVKALDVSEVRIIDLCFNFMTSFLEKIKGLLDGK